MGGDGTEHDADLIKGVKMLELHVVVRVPGVVVKEVEKTVAFLVYPDEIPVLVEHHILDQHCDASSFPAGNRGFLLSAADG